MTEVVVIEYIKNMFVLPDLPYDYSSLEPFIDTETMNIHHDKHHATYVKNLNDLLLDREDFLNMEVNELLLNLDKVPEQIRQKVKNNAGGIANHNMFWEIMSPASDYKEPDEDSHFNKKLMNDLGSWSGFQEYFNEEALKRFGSGWVWLYIEGGNLEVESTANQDSPISEGKTPILCLDVWEHAYYLKYKNMRADYIKAWWNVVNWKEVEKRFEEVSRE